jgi:signal transduction histidine kinase
LKNILESLNPPLFPFFIYDRTKQNVETYDGTLQAIPIKYNRRHLIKLITTSTKGIQEFKAIDDGGLAVVGIQTNDYIIGYFSLRIIGLHAFHGKSEPKLHEYPAELANGLLNILKNSINLQSRTKKLETAINSIKSLRHDLDNFGDLLYNQAESLYRELSKKYERSDHKIKLNNDIIYLSDLIISRTFLAAFSNFPQTTLVKESIQPYKSFDTIIRAFQPYAEHKSIIFKYDEKNNVKSTINSYQKPLFQTIPFIIIDNAIKYSPRNHNINIRGMEFENSIAIEIESFGPMLLEHERSKIFSFEFRGDLAQKHTDDGSGIGLNTLKQLVDTIHNGSVGFKQDYGKRKTISGIDYVPTFVKVVFPIAPESHQ